MPQYGLNTPPSGYGYGVSPYVRTTPDTVSPPPSGYGYGREAFSELGDTYAEVGPVWDTLTESQKQQVFHQLGAYDTFAQEAILEGFSIGGFFKGIGKAVTAVVKGVGTAIGVIKNKLPEITQIAQTTKQIIDGKGQTTVISTPGTTYSTGGYGQYGASSELSHAMNLNAPATPGSAALWLIGGGALLYFLAKK